VKEIRILSVKLFNKPIHQKRSSPASLSTLYARIFSKTLACAFYYIDPLTDERHTFEDESAFNEHVSTLADIDVLEVSDFRQGGDVAQKVFYCNVLDDESINTVKLIESHEQLHAELFRSNTRP